MNHQPGDLLHNNRYRIVKLLGKGGMGAVYRAWDTVLNKQCALKENLDPSPEAARQFTREAMILANLTHPRLPRVTDHFVIPGHGQYLVMDLIEGEDLQQKLEAAGRPLPAAQVIAWLRQVCDALTYLHSQNPPIIHRDIKPGNIKIASQDEAMLVDFGLAKVYDPNLKTTQGARGATPGFTPFEQYGQGSTDARTDVYALGATAYYLLTAQEPVESIKRLQGALLPPPRSFNSQISPPVEQAILKAMEVYAPNRFATAAEFKAALLLTPPTQRITTPPTKVTPRAAPPAYQRASVGSPLPLQPLIGIGVIVIVALLICGGLFFASQFTAIPATNTLPPATNTRLPALSTVVNTVPPSGTDIPFPTPAPTLARTPTIDPSLGIGSTQVSPQDGMTLLYVPAGSFTMGSNSGGSSEKPVHTITLNAFWIDKTEVTNAMYALCVKAGVCATPVATSSNTRSSYYGNAQYNNYPVIYVSWNDAVKYCGWAGRRLPSEAEWEKAARGADGRAYPWGSTFDAAKLNSYEGNAGDTTEVGKYPGGVSPYGALDMAGNVWEWVNDWYDETYYSKSPSQNPTGPTSGQYRALRGGAWNYLVNGARASVRYGDVPSGSVGYVGFRCVSSP